MPRKKIADKTLKDNSDFSVSELVKNSSFPRDEDKKKMLELLND